jgi:hypothetical protein
VSIGYSGGGPSVCRLLASGITEKEMHLFRGARSADAPAFMTTAVALYEQMDTAGA